MSKALVQMERNSAGVFVPVGVWQATPKRLSGRMLPGSVGRDNFYAMVMNDATRPTLGPYTTARGTWEDWIDWASWSLYDGQTRQMIEVTPEVTIDQLYDREVLGIMPTRLSPQKLRPQLVAPDTLHGYKGNRLRGGLGGSMSSK